MQEMKTVRLKEDRAGELDLQLLNTCKSKFCQSAGRDVFQLETGAPHPPYPLRPDRAVILCHDEGNYTFYLK